jgi:hypothetical protein
MARGGGPHLTRSPAAGGPPGRPPALPLRRYSAPPRLATPPAPGPPRNASRNPPNRCPRESCRRPGVAASAAAARCGPPALCHSRCQPPPPPWPRRGNPGNPGNPRCHRGSRHRRHCQTDPLPRRLRRRCPARLCQPGSLRAPCWWRRAGRPQRGAPAATHSLTSVMSSTCVRVAPPGTTLPGHSIQPASLECGLSVKPPHATRPLALPFALMRGSTRGLQLRYAW